MKFALVSHVLPPAGSGQAMLIYQLLKGLDPDQYCLISQRTFLTRDYLGEYQEPLPGRHYQLPLEVLMRGLRFGLARPRMRLNMPIGTVERGLRIAAIIRRERCEAVLAFTGNIVDLPASYLASRLSGVPFYAYICDYYSEREYGSPLERAFVKRAEPIVLRGAAGVITTNEMLHESLYRRYGVASTMIHHPCDLAQYEPTSGADPGECGDEVRIVYTGAIYEAHYDAFHNLLAAIAALGRPQVRLHVYTAQAPAELVAKGLRGPIVLHEHQVAAAMPGIQQGADILFLPLAFNSPYPKLIETAAPFKMGEYLASGRPILVHAPHDSFIAWYFRHHDCGLVVDEPDPAALARALERLATDGELRRRLGVNARARAEANFSVGIARDTFATLLQLREAPRNDAQEHRARCP